MCLQFKKHRELFSDPVIYLNPGSSLLGCFLKTALTDIVIQTLCPGSVMWLNAILAQKIICM